MTGSEFCHLPATVDHLHFLECEAQAMTVNAHSSRKAAVAPRPAVDSAAAAASVAGLLEGGCRGILGGCLEEEIEF